MKLDIFSLFYPGGTFSIRRCMTRRHAVRIIEDLAIAKQQQGFNVSYRHCRYDKRGRLKVYGKGQIFRGPPQTHGGVTVCSAVHLETGRVFTGVAVCQPEDAFTYREGRQLAWDKAYEQFLRLEGIAW